MIVPRTSLLFEKALKRYQDMTDRYWSLTDCASFRSLEEERLTFGLTPERHFAPSRIAGNTAPGQNCFGCLASSKPPRSTIFSLMLRAAEPLSLTASNAVG